MIFTDFAFLIFFAILFPIHWFSRVHQRKYVLLIFSYLFYAWWDWRFIGLLAGVTAVTWLATNLYRKHRIRGQIVIGLGLIILLLQLSIFKYSGFLLEIVTNIVPNNILPVNKNRFTLILPVGISFFTFQAMSYLIDIQRKKIETYNSLVETALYISFFPQLVAGPIIRSTVFFPQLNSPKKLSNGDITFGVNCFLIGYVYKAIFADKLAPFVDQVFSQPEIYQPQVIWFGLIGFSGQIYFDFAGYSLMAIGIARLLGYIFPENFNHPYCSLSLIEFWKRWHISLSEWFRDYVYIPLGGNKKGAKRRAVNLLLTMTLCGLWHGAGWNFIFWGVTHGIGAMINHWWRNFYINKYRGLRTWILIPICLSWLLTQLFVLISWVPFRTESLSDLVLVFQKMFGLSNLTPSLEYVALEVPYLLIMLPLVVDTTIGFCKKHLAAYELPATIYWFSLGAVLAGALMLIPLENRNFVYFQF